MSAAPIDPLASPVAMPCKDLAAYSAAVSCAARKTAHPATLRTKAVMVPGSGKKESDIGAEGTDYEHQTFPSAITDVNVVAEK